MNRLHDPEDSELIQRAVKDDQSALGKLFDRHRERLRRMIVVRLDPALAARVDPSDVIQETLIEAARKLPDYSLQPLIPFYPWLRRIAWERIVHIQKRHLVAQRRSVRREVGDNLQLSDESVMEFAERFAASQTSPSQGLLRKELQLKVRAGLKELTANDREILVLRFLEELSTEEAAAVLNITPAAAAMRQLRALERLRERLVDPLDEE